MPTNLQTKKLILQRLKGLGPIIETWQAFKFLVKILTWLIICGSVLWLASLLVDVNAFSMHGMYCNRLVRAYLG